MRPHRSRITATLPYLLLVAAACTDGAIADPPPVEISAALALAGTATASSIQGTGLEAAKAVDGNMGTRWSSQFSDPQWLTVDLGATHSINRVTINWQNSYAKDYQVRVSTDNATWTTIQSITNSDGGLDDLQGLSGSGRYVQIYGTRRATQYGYSIWEIQIAAPDATTGSGGAGATGSAGAGGATGSAGASGAAGATGAAGAAGATGAVMYTGLIATASSVQGTGLEAAKAVDGNTTTRWSSAFSDPQWLTVDLGAPKSITRVVLNWEAAYGKAYQIRTSNDNATWTTIKTVTAGDGGVDDLTGLAGNGRYVEMYGTTRATA
ncbi:MAG TPA: discoidin domain-containing protein [Polyangia bacterium]|nr:discoidin domain-containing protein [Polyangia bacterium]